MLFLAEGNNERLHELENLINAHFEILYSLTQQIVRKGITCFD